MKKQMQYFFSSLLVFVFFSVLMLLSVDVALAGPGLQNPLDERGINDMTGLLRVVLSAFMAIMFPITVLFIVYTGFLFVTSQGNPAKILEARKYLIYTVIGALLILGSYALSTAIRATVNNIAPGTI